MDIPEAAVKDTYRSRQKLLDPTLCPRCHAVYHKGRWQWREQWPYGVHQEICPACCRIQDDFPAGWLILKGDFVHAHRIEVIAIARRQQHAENDTRPLNRIIKIIDTPGGMLITTTDIHLPRRIGSALRRAHGGALETHYDPDAYAVRVVWTSARAESPRPA
jgi:hypothetical protein